MFVVDTLIESIHHPVSSSFLLLSLWCGVKLLYKHWKIDDFAMSYHDCVKKKQVWKCLSTSLSHSSWVHLLFDIVTIWSNRVLEGVYGPFFYFRYSLVMILSECCITLLLLRSINFITRIRDNPFETTRFSGSSGMLLAWLTYASVESITRDDLYHNIPYYYIGGFFPMIWIFTPVFLALIIPIIANRHNAVANISGLLTGYLMYFGVLQILPDLYWCICYGLNLFLFIMIMVCNQEDTTSTTTTLRNILNTDHEVLPVLEYHTIVTPTSLSSSTGRYQDIESAGGVGGRGTRTYHEAEDDQQRLLLDSEEYHEGDSLLHTNTSYARRLSYSNMSSSLYQFRQSIGHNLSNFFSRTTTAITPSSPTSSSANVESTTPRSTVISMNLPTLSPNRIETSPNRLNLSPMAHATSSTLPSTTTNTSVFSSQKRYQPQYTEIRSMDVHEDDDDDDVVDNQDDRIIHPKDRYKH